MRGEHASVLPLEPYHDPISPPRVVVEAKSRFPTRSARLRPCIPSVGDCSRAAVKDPWPHGHRPIADPSGSLQIGVLTPGGDAEESQLRRQPANESPASTPSASTVLLPCGDIVDLLGHAAARFPVLSGQNLKATLQRLPFELCQGLSQAEQISR